MAEGRLPFERTVILLDTNKSYAEHEVADLTFALKSRKEGSFMAKKTVQTLCVEGISEYCRVMYDIFPEDALVCVMTAGEENQRFNEWSPEHQSMKQIMDGFADCVPSEAPDGYLSASLQQAVQALIEPLPYEGKPQLRNRTRLIVVMQNQPDTHMFSFLDGAPEEGEEEESRQQDIAALLDSLIKEANVSIGDASMEMEDEYKRQRAIEHCELVLLRLRDVSNTGDCKSHPPKKISNHLTAYVHEVSPVQITDVLSDLSIVHFNLSSIRVTGIPMKESSADSTRAIYDVVLLHPAENQNPYSAYFSTPRNEADIVAEWAKTNHHILGSHRQRLAQELVVLWKTAPKGATVESFACSRIMRVSPLDLRSSPSVCLMKHILSDKLVTLITPEQGSYQEGKIMKAAKASSPIPASHLLHAYNGDVFLRRLHTPLNCTDVTLDRIYSLPLHNLRVKSFAKVIEANTHLRLSKLQNAKKKAGQGNTKAGMKTRAKKKLVPTKPSFANERALIDVVQEVDQMDLEEKMKERPKMTHIDAPGVRYISTETMERMTRVFPSTKNSTLIFGRDRSKELKQLLRPFKHAFIKKEGLSEDIKETVIESVTRLYQLAHANDVRVFPQFSGSQPTRKEAYRQLWLELLAYAERMSAHEAHQQIISAMKSLWPVDQPLESDASTSFKPQEIGIVADSISPEAAQPGRAADSSVAQPAQSSGAGTRAGTPQNMPQQQKPGASSSSNPRTKVNDALKGRMKAKGKPDRKSGGKGPRPDRDRPEREGDGVKEWESVVDAAGGEKDREVGAAWQDLERFENIEKLREKGREDIETERRGLKREREEEQSRRGRDDGDLVGNDSSVFNLFYSAKQERLAKKAVEFDGRLSND